ncbi:MAG TPA: MucB/RseB C-terminal domain-containing protein [Pseudomonadales bacterium]|nr:MucB/RseB C-terminal domain-containing protein [Pseudomonadales bacterium]
MRPLAVLACLLPGFLSVPLHAVEAGDPASRLDAMSRSFRSLDYHGVFTYEQGQSLSSVRIAHAVVDGVEQERLVHLDGEQREFVRRGHRVDCEHAGDRLMRLDPAARFAQRAQTGVAGAQLGDHYAIEFDGSERVANHRGQRIRIVPRDPYRYGMNVVLDEASSLLLKSETTDGAGRVLERFQFVDLQIGAPVAAAELAPETPGAHHAAGHAGAEEPAPFAWTVAWLPEGFVATGREVRSARAGGPAVEVQSYTDGLAVFAVFVERTAERPPHAGQASRGATVSYVVPRDQEHLVTVVGEIPVETAQLIANGVNFPDATP